jgi:hypothetical protein
MQITEARWTDVLATRNASHEIVTNHRVDGVADPKETEHDVSEVLGELSLREPVGRVARCPGFRRELKGVTDRKHREVDVDFSGVDGFAAELLGHLLWRDTFLSVLTSSQPLDEARSDSMESSPPL